MSEEQPRSGGEESGAAENPVPPPATDPWKGFRGVMAGALVLEAITVLLALPVVAQVGGGLSWWSITYLVGLAVLMFLGAGLQRRSWAMQFNIAMQVLLLVGTVVNLSIGIIGIVFVAVWAFILILRADVKKRMDRGLLPSQRSV